MTIVGEAVTTGLLTQLTDARPTTAAGTTLVQSGTRGATPAKSATHAAQTAATSAARAATTAVSRLTGAMSLVESMPLEKFRSMTARWVGRVPLRARRPARA